MPCISGRHNFRQILIEVAIVHPDDKSQHDGSTSSYLKNAQTFTALVDTGATTTMISPRVVAKIGLVPIGKMPFGGISGERWHNAYLFHVGFAGHPVPLSVVQVPDPDLDAKWAKVHVYKPVIKGGELPDGTGFDVLLGMDVISTGRLEIDRSGDFSFTF